MMTLENDQHLAKTQEHLKHFEARLQALREQPDIDPRVRDLTMRSLQRVISQLKEQIARYRAHHPAAA